MNKSLQGRFREVIHNNYTLYYFVHMYTQIYDENALIWVFPRRMFRPPPTWKFDVVNNQYSYSYVKGAKRNSRCVAILRSPRVIKITVFVILEKI
jgi:hypothetical protein